MRRNVFWKRILRLLPASPSGSIAPKNSSRIHLGHLVQLTQQSIGRPAGSSRGEFGFHFQSDVGDFLLGKSLPRFQRATCACGKWTTLHSVVSDRVLFRTSSQFMMKSWWWWRFSFHIFFLFKYDYHFLIDFVAENWFKRSFFIRMHHGCTIIKARSCTMCLHLDFHSRI